MLFIYDESKKSMYANKNKMNGRVLYEVINLKGQIEL